MYGPCKPSRRQVKTGQRQIGIENGFENLEKVCVVPGIHSPVAFNGLKQSEAMVDSLGPHADALFPVLPL